MASPLPPSREGHPRTEEAPVSEEAEAKTESSDVEGGAESVGGEESRPVSVTFRGHTVSLWQQPREREEGDDNTGWMAWECANIMLRFLDSHPLHRSDSASHSASDSLANPFQRLRLVDVSAGLGLLSVCAAMQGAHVVATDIPSQMPLLQRNLDAHNAALRTHGGLVEPVSLFWGDDMAPVLEALARAEATSAGTGSPSESSGSSADVLFDVCTISDVLFIALRDGLTEALTAAIRACCTVSRVILFGFEERLIRDETEYMDALAALSDLSVKELEVPELEKEDRLVGCGGAETDTDDLFWEPPPVRLFRITSSLCTE